MTPARVLARTSSRFFVDYTPTATQTFAALFDRNSEAQTPQVPTVLCYERGGRE